MEILWINIYSSTAYSFPGLKSVLSDLFVIVTIR